MHVLFDALAQQELEDAVEYYDLEVAGLGERFRDEVRRGIKRVVEHPTAWAVLQGTIRRYILHKFPYRILYSIETDDIYIIAIAHAHRRPDYWFDRRES